MTLTTTDAPNLPLVIGIPFLCMAVIGAAIIGLFWVLERSGRQ